VSGGAVSGGGLVQRLDIEGAAAPPRRNGELVFTEPWQSRAFGLVMALCDGGRLEWEEFRRELIAQVGAWEAGRAEGEAYDYWRCWLGALEGVAGRHGLVAAAEVDGRAGWLAATATGGGHHGHPHSH
jgi:nitrile hydratase accessory protein